MNSFELSQKYEILPELYGVFELVKNTSHKDIVFQIVVDLQNDGTTKVARERMPNHIIKIKESEIARINHIIAHECCHILRIMAVDPSLRVIPATNVYTLKKAFSDLSEQAQVLPTHIRENVLTIWVNGLMMQLTNLPVDARIERWLYKNYPALRPAQIESLTIDAGKTIMGLSKQAEKFTIDKVFSISNSMTYAYLRAIGEITGVNYGPKFYNHIRIVDSGKKLFTMLGYDDGGYNHDLDTIKAWGDYLNITEWFEWICFEDVPDTYINII